MQLIAGEMNLLPPSADTPSMPIGTEIGRRGGTMRTRWPQDDRVVNVNVGGNVVEVRKGEIYFPGPGG